MSARVAGTLFATALMLGAALVYQALAPVPPIVVGGAEAAPRPPPPFPLPVFNPPPESEFAAINARAAFNPARTPVAEPAQSGMTSQTPPDVALVGVAIGPRKSVALLKPANGGAASSVAIGQTVQGWQLVRIDPGSVVFHANGTDYTVKLRAATGLTPTMPGAPRGPHQAVPGQPPSYSGQQ